MNEQEARQGATAPAKRKRTAGGRRPGPDGILAQELGISRRRIKIAGGAVKLMALSPDARAVLLKMEVPE